MPVHVVAAPPYSVIGGTGDALLDGAPLALGRVALGARDGAIAAAAVAVSMHLPRRVLRSVVLEEVVQATGLVTDVAGAAYGDSIFHETGNDVARLRGQDAAAVRRHYAGDD